MTRKRVLLADDHRIVADGLKSILADQYDLVGIVENGRELLRRAEADPKPLYYRPEFLDTQLEAFMHERGHGEVTQIRPDDFVLWMFPRLFAARIPRYEAIARDHGYTIRADVLAQATTEAEFLACMERMLEE